MQFDLTTLDWKLFTPHHAKFSDSYNCKICGFFDLFCEHFSHPSLPCRCPPSHWFPPSYFTSSSHTTPPPPRPPSPPTPPSPTSPPSPSFSPHSLKGNSPLHHLHWRTRYFHSHPSHNLHFTFKSFSKSLCLFLTFHLSLLLLPLVCQQFEMCDKTRLLLLVFKPFSL